MTPGADEVILLLNQAKYLCLRHISEPEDNALRLVVEEAIADRSQTVSATNSASPFSEIRKGAVPIKSVKGCKTFELQWSRYVAYLVTEQLVGSGGSESGTLLSTCSAVWSAYGVCQAFRWGFNPFPNPRLVFSSYDEKQDMIKTDFVTNQKCTSRKSQNCEIEGGRLLPRVDYLEGVNCLINASASSNAVKTNALRATYSR